jgi:hypothetical protein
MKQKKHDRAWFERKAGELEEKIRRLSNERQLELFDQLNKPEEPSREQRKKETR